MCSFIYDGHAGPFLLIIQNSNISQNNTISQKILKLKKRTFKAKISQLCWKSQFPGKQHLESKITFFTFNVKNSSRVNFHFSSLFHSNVQMSRNSSMSFRAVSGTVLSLAITFTLIIWGCDMIWYDVVFWDKNVQEWWCSPPRYLARHKGCYLVTIWVVLTLCCWTGNYLQLS